MKSVDADTDYDWDAREAEHQARIARMRKIIASWGPPSEASSRPRTSEERIANMRAILARWPTRTR